MKKIKWEILMEGEKIAIAESLQGFQNGAIETHMTVIGLLENLKKKHLEKMTQAYHKSIKQDKDGNIISSEKEEGCGRGHGEEEEEDGC